MRAPAIILGVLLIALGGYVVAHQLQGGSVKAIQRNTSQAASPIPHGTRALTGSWEGVSKNDVPIRLVVEEIHSDWALVLFAWGRNADGSRPQGSIRTRAKILSDGRLNISYPVHLNFSLSEDLRSLIGTTVNADPLASVLLTRVEQEEGRG